ncbi:MAG: MoaD/ThiS family protein [Verrucomicrobiales bacterium]|nr:MoaD/ThiS family protein [Verrucomicrobiales bacterium]
MPIRVRIRYWSWFKDLTHTPESECTLPDGATVADVLHRVHQEHPRLAEARKSTLVAVGVEYQPPDHILHEGDEVSLFPPVQGG